MKSLRGRQYNKPTMAERIAYYLRRTVVDPETGCWLWQGKRRVGDGYAVVSIEYKDRLLHQVVYEWVIGDRPSGTNLHHTCETKHCVNPQHLELHTIADHVRLHPEAMAAAAKESARRARARTHCQRGHEFNAENTYWTKHGWRMCRVCANLKRRERRAA